MTAENARWSVIRIAVSFLICALVVFAPGMGSASDDNDASLVLDVGTGEILHASNADARRYPASLTKMMTLFMLFEAVEANRLSLDTRMRVSERASSQPPSKIGLEPGQTITVDDAIKALAIKSANDVATVVAEHLAGTEYNFANAMTIRARQLGMTRTTFRNASGLPDPDQLSTARDMAILASALLRDFPHRYHVFSSRTFTYNGRSYRNHNRLLDQYSGMDGIKTGYIRASGFNLVASAQRNGRRLIGVVFGGRSSARRNIEMASLLDQGFGVSKPTIMVDNRGNSSGGGGGAWGVQVGAYGDKGSALRSAQNAVRQVKAFAPQASAQVIRSKGRDKRNYHLARVLDLDKGDAYEACRVLKQKRFKCLVLRDRNAADVRTANAGASESRIGTPFPKPTFSNAVAANTAAPAEVGKAGSWGVQVGAFIGIDLARDAARDASANVTNHLAYGVPAVVKRTYRDKRGTRTMYLARVHGVSKESASLACRQLRNDRKDCMVLRVTDNMDIAWAPSGEEMPVVAQGSTPNAGEGSGFGAAWGVQVGVVPTKGSAQKIAAEAIATLPDPLEAGSIKVVPLAVKKGGTLYRARVVGITKPQAHDACRALKTRKIPCMVLRVKDPDAA